MRWSLLSLTFLLGCPKAADTTDPEPTDAAAETSQTSTQTPNLGGGDAPPLEARAVAVGRCVDPDKDPIIVSSARIEGERLIATVQYGGGCEEHTFSACWDGVIAESMPTQTSLRIIHDANGDTCRARKTQALSLDLKPLARAKPTIISLHGVTVQYGG